MVGTNNAYEYRVVYTPIVMNIWTQIFQSLTASQKYFMSNSSARDERSSLRRLVTSLRSGSERKRAVSG